MAQMTTGSKPVDRVERSEPLLRISDIATRLSISQSMAWKIINGGQLRSMRIGRAVRVRPADLESYITDASRES